MFSMWSYQNKGVFIVIQMLDLWGKKCTRFFVS